MLQFKMAFLLFADKDKDKDMDKDKDRDKDVLLYFQNRLYMKRNKMRDSGPSSGNNSSSLEFKIGLDKPILVPV